ncbi:MAG: TolC family protein [Acidobacteriia bacterium]|nr:TolC family protein [Terriglobia bacterium]
MKRMLTVAALLVGLLPCGVRLLADEPLRLTLDEAIRRGLDASHRIAEAVARGDAADAAIGGRHAALLPQIAAQAGYTRTNHVDEFGIPVPPTGQLRVIYPDVPDNYRTRLDLQWPIYTGGRLDALERAARIDATASADDIAVARADLTLEITRAYWALVTAIESVAVVQESVTRVDAHLRDVRNQLAAGLVPPNDVLTVEAQESRQRMLAIQARSLRTVAEADLARLIGADPALPLEPVSTLDVAPASGGALDQLIATAREQRPERALLVKRLAAARERGVAASAGSRPTVAVGGGVDYAQPNPRIFPREEAWKSSWDASITVSWPLFDGGRTRSDVAETTATARAVQERIADFDVNIAAEIRQRLSEAESSRAAIEAAADAVRSATEARRVVGERFAAGVATSTDVLDAQVALLQAQLDRTQAFAAIRFADARLARAVGR